MRTTLIDQKEIEVDAQVDGDRVLVSTEDLEEVTGWSIKPEGLCRGEVCVPVRDPVMAGDLVDLGATAKALGRAFVFSDGVGALAGDPMSSGMREKIDVLELSDLDGNLVRMSDLAGRKRLLIAWASW